MAKKRIKRNDRYSNTYNLGGWMNGVNNKIDASSFGKAIGGSSGLGGITNAAASTVSGLINPSGNSTGVGNALQGIGSVASNIPGIGGVIGAGVNLVGGLINAAFGSNLNEEFIAQTEDKTKQQAGYVSSAEDNASLLSDWTSYTDMAHVKRSDVGSDGWFSNKAKNKTKALNRAIDEANLRAWNSLDNTASNVDTNNDFLAMANFSAYGGPLNTYAEGGGIHFNSSMNKFKNRLYNNLSPIGYEDLSRVPKAIFLNEPDIFHNKMKDMPVLDEIYAQYLGIPEKNRHFNKRLEKSKYKPTQGGKNVTYYKLPQKTIDGRTILGDNHRYGSGIANTYVDSMVFDATHMKPGENKQQLNTELGYYTVGRGRDNKGDYVSYYDKWDINPFSGRLQNNTALPSSIRKMLKDVNLDFGTPVNIYDRIYFDDYYGVKGEDRGGHYLPEVIVTGERKEYKDGGSINITPSKRGTFTAAAKKHGKGVQEFASQVLANKENYSPAMVKKANFARNASKWKHADGGELHTHGGDFTNGLTYIDNGGSHEANPFEGVQMGIDPQGVPNLVEEGEVIFNDYVFSNRLKVPKAIRQKYKLRDNITFAEAAKKLGKESEERPNDPISKRGLESFMSALAESQEEVRIKNEDRRMNRYAKGGKLGKRYDGPGPDDNYMDFGTLASPISYEQLERMINLGIDGNAIPLTGTSEEIDNAITRAAVEKGATTGDKSNLSYLRYAPALMSGISAFTDLFSKPDYSAADRVASVDIQPALVSADPIGQYLSYKPLDRMFYINQLNKNTAASRRAIQNTSGGNRAAALAGILAADYNYGENLGKLARQAEEYNQAQKEKVAGFNRQTDMFNSQQSMQAQSANAQSRNDATKMRLAQAEEVAKLRQAARNAYDTRRSNNLNNFINNLGNIGWEEKQAEWLDNLAKRGVLLMNTSGEYTGVTKKNEGKLKKKRRTIYA